MNLSVVIPTINRFEYLHSIICSLRQQTVLPSEIIVVDQSVENCSSKLPKEISYIHTAPCGPSAARNIGAEKAGGDVLLFVDDDGEIGPDFVEKHLSWYCHEFIDVVHGGVQQAGRPMPDEPELPKGASAAEWLRLSPNCKRRQMCIGLASGNFSIRRNVFFEVGGFDERIGRAEDKELGARLFRAGRIIIYDPAPLFVHLRAAGGTRSPLSPSLWTGFLRPEPHPGEYMLYLKHWPGWQARLWIMERLSIIWTPKNIIRPDRCIVKTIRLWRCIREANKLLSSTSESSRIKAK